MSGPALPAVVRVAAAGLPSGAGAVAAPVTGPVPAGTTLLVACTANNTMPTIGVSGVTDTAGNIYAEDSSLGTAAPSLLCFASDGQTGGPGGGPTAPLGTSDVITAAFTGSAAIRTITVLGEPSSRIAAALAISTSTNPQLPLAMTPPVPDCAIVVMGVAPSGINVTAVPAGWTQETPPAPGGPAAFNAWTRAAGLTPVTGNITFNGGGWRRRQWACAPVEMAVAYPLKAWDGDQWIDLSAPRAQAFDGTGWLALR